MNWLNVNVTKLRDDVFAGATPEELGIWLRLVAYCALMENGGGIIGCEPWTERQWQTTCGISKAEVDVKSRLWRFGGNEGVLWVYGYPKEQEAVLKAKRAGGKRGARKRWKPKNVVHLEADNEGVL